MGNTPSEHRNVVAQAYLNKHDYLKEGTLIQDLRTGDIFRILGDEEKFHRVTCSHREYNICFTMNVRVERIGVPGHFLGEEGKVDLSRDQFQVVPEVALLSLQDPDYRKAVVGHRMLWSTEARGLARINAEPIIDSDGDWAVYISVNDNVFMYRAISDRTIIRWNSPYNDDPYYLE